MWGVFLVHGLVIHALKAGAGGGGTTRGLDAVLGVQHRLHHLDGRVHRRQLRLPRSPRLRGGLGARDQRQHRCPGAWATGRAAGPGGPKAGGMPRAPPPPTPQTKPERVGNWATGMKLYLQPDLRLRCFNHFGNSNIPPSFPLKRHITGCLPAQPPSGGSGAAGSQS